MIILLSLSNSASDFTSIALIAQIPVAIVTHSSLPASSLADLIAMARAQPACRARIYRLRADELCRSVVRADPPVITLAPPAPIVAVAKKADVVVVETVTMEPMDTPYAAHAAHAAPVTTHVTDVTSCKSKGANMSSAETATDMTSAKAATASAKAATAMTTTTATTPHQHQKTAPCIQIGVIGKARLREGFRGRKSKRQSADNAKGDDAAFHDCTSRGHLRDKFAAPPQAIGGHLRLAIDPPPSGFFLKGACK